ncbi:MAG: phage terminase large subunit, partial [Actinomycetes bacterium]
RYTKAALEKIRDRSGSYWFGALYQQRPSSSGDGIFQRKDFRYWTQATTGDGSVLYQLHTPDGGTILHAKEDCLHFQTIDLAVTAKTSSDFSVVSTWAATPNRELLLVGRERHRLEAADQSSKLKAWWDAWKLTTKMRFLGVEKTAYHLEVVQTLRRQAVPVKELTPDKDKVARAIPAGALCEAGRAYFPKRAEWLEEWEHELLQFPNGKYDDQTDTFSYAVSELHRLPVRRRKKEDPGGRKMEDRLAARLDKMLNKRKKRPHHPELGRL